MEKRNFTNTKSVKKDRVSRFVMSKGKKRNQTSKPVDTPKSEERRTEEDIRNDEQEVAHFRDVHLINYVKSRFNTPFSIMLHSCC